MHLRSVTIENIKSFRAATAIDFDQSFNVLVGPNAGGKSNLLDIVTTVLRRYFLYGYGLQEGVDGQGRYFKNLQRRVLFDQIEPVLEKFMGNEASPSRISVSFVVGAQDLANITAIKNSQAALVRTLNDYREKPDANLGVLHTWDPSQLTEGQDLSFQVENYALIENTLGVGARMFLEYLRHLEMFLILARDYPALHVKPAQLYFSPYRSANPADLQATLSSENLRDMMTGYYQSTSRSSTSLVKMATLHFAEKMRGFEMGAVDAGYSRRWNEDPEVRLVTGYLARTGYAWSLVPKDPKKNIYEIVLERDGKPLYVSQASSGEKEILNFILGIFAFGISDGLVIIDEPELHLHPRWQSVLRDLLSDIARATRNQILISTHSPVFITTETIGSVRRVFKKGDAGSQVVDLGSHIGDRKPLLHIVNTHNNERLFFADKVVLVEGIQDRIIFEKLIAHYADLFRITEIIEIVEVHGKANFSNYKEFLDALEVPTRVIADLDYVYTVADASTKNLFSSSLKKVEANVLRNKKSKDRQGLAEQLDMALRTEDLNVLRSLWEYIKARHSSLRDDLTGTDRERLDTFLASKRAQQIYVLRRGEIEDYLPADSRSLGATVELARDENFMQWLRDSANDEGLRELQSIVLDILEISETRRREVLNRAGLLGGVLMCLQEHFGRLSAGGVPA